MRPFNLAWHAAATGLARLTSSEVSCANALHSANELTAARREREEISAMLASRVLPDLG